MNKNYAFQIPVFLIVSFLTVSAYSQTDFETLRPLTKDEELQYWDLAYREWELADGTKIWAQYVSVGKNTIILKNEDQEPVILKTWELSKEDAKFQREQWKKSHGKVKAHWDEESAQEFLDESYREWELANGTKIDARYESVEENSILLYTIDGNYIKLKTKELSKEDIKFQKYLWQKQLRKDRQKRAEKRKQR